MTQDSGAKSERIAQLNDAFRQTLRGGQVFLTAGVSDLPAEEVASLLGKVRKFDAFSEDNDPWGEHDFGSFDHHGNKIYWKIDYYDKRLEWGSEDPADPDQTIRVLTVMLAEEY